MDPVKLVAHLVKNHSSSHPRFVRMLLALAYKTVSWRGTCASSKSYAGIIDSFNGKIARSITKSLLHPKKSVMVNIYLPCEALYALGLTPMFPEGISVYVACTRSSLPFVQAAENIGIPESFCSYHKLMLGMDALHVLPKPALIANTTLACDANQLSFRVIAEKGQGEQISRCVIDVPYIQQENSARSCVDESHLAQEDCCIGEIHLVAEQLRVMTKMMEEMFHTKLDEKVLVAACERSYKTLCNLKEYVNLRSSISLPTTLTGELCLFVASHVMAGSREALQFSEQLLHLARSTSPEIDTHSRPRIFWLHTLPNWQESVMNIFEHTALETCAELVGNDVAFDYIPALDGLDPSDPYDFMARRLVLGSANGPAKRRIDAALAAAQEAGAEGAVLFAHWGCRQTGAMAQLAKEAFEEAGIPLLVLDGDGCDPRNASDGQMVTRLEAFIEQLRPIHASS